MRSGRPPALGRAATPEIANQQQATLSPARQGEQRSWALVGSGLSRRHDDARQLGQGPGEGAV